MPDIVMRYLFLLLPLHIADLPDDLDTVRSIAPAQHHFSVSCVSSYETSARLTGQIEDDQKAHQQEPSRHKSAGIRSSRSSV